MSIFKNVKTLKYFWRMLARPGIIEHCGVKLKVKDPSVSAWVRDAIYKGFYELAEATLLKSHLRSDDIVVEIGAGIGFIGALCSSAKKVVIYEANPKLLPLIETNISLNGCKATIVNAAIVRDEEMKDIDFYVGPNFWNASLVPNLGFDRIKVPTLTLEIVLNEHKPTFLIVDVEGYEVKLLNSFSFPDTTRKILIEMHDRKVSEADLNRLRDSIKGKGFALVDSSDQSEMYVR